jgi:hypothetical protein
MEQNWIEQEYVIPEWVYELATKLKTIEEQWKRDTFRRYRECGQLILESGYEKGKWNQVILEEFMKLTNYGHTVIYYMVKLGKMTDTEFSDVIGNFTSLYAWSHPKALESKPDKSKKPTMEKLMIPASRFKSESEAREFFLSFDGVYEGLFYHGKVNREIAEQNKFSKT